MKTQVKAVGATFGAAWRKTVAQFGARRFIEAAQPKRTPKGSL